MDKKQIVIIFILLLILSIFIFLRSITALPGLKIVFTDLNDIFITNRSYSYGQKIEKLWKNDYRYSVLARKIVSYPDAINFGSTESGNILHPNIIANFIYPLRITATESSSYRYEAIYPGKKLLSSNNCSEVYIFDIDKITYTTLKCSDYYNNYNDFRESLGLIKK